MVKSAFNIMQLEDSTEAVTLNVHYSQVVFPVYPVLLGNIVYEEKQIQYTLTLLKRPGLHIDYSYTKNGQFAEIKRQVRSIHSKSLLNKRKKLTCIKHTLTCF